MKTNRGAIVLTIIAFIVIAAIGYYFVFFLPQKNADLSERQELLVSGAEKQDQRVSGTEETKYVPDPEAPRFGDFPVKTKFTEVPAPPNFKTNRDALLYRTAITDGAKKGPNFSGEYTVIEYGCGTDCQLHTIVNAKTGAIVSYNDGKILSEGGNQLSSG